MGDEGMSREDLERMGQEEIDDLVYDCCVLEAELNAEADGRAQEELIEEGEARAGRINNGGREAQIAYILGEEG